MRSSGVNLPPSSDRLSIFFFRVSCCQCPLQCATEIVRSLLRDPVEMLRQHPLAPTIIVQHEMVAQVCILVSVLMEILRQHAVTTADVNIFALGIFLLEPPDQRIEQERIYCLLGPVWIEQHMPLLLKGDGRCITSPP